MTLFADGFPSRHPVPMMLAAVLLARQRINRSATGKQGGPSRSADGEKLTAAIPISTFGHPAFSNIAT
jgi:hypothetical protein